MSGARAFAIAMVAGLALASAAWAECVAPPGAPTPETLQQRIFEDRAGRSVAPVFINGEGPFRFIVDTGANRSVISSNLAARLGLVAHGVGEVHTVESLRLAPMVRVASFSVGAMRLVDIETPVLDGEVMAGQHGLLGVDGMVSRRILLDFERRCVEITDARGAGPLRGWLRAQGRLEAGHSFLIDGRIRGVDITVLLDTGSNISLGNQALRRALIPEHAQRWETHGQYIYSGGRPIVSDQVIWTPRLSLAGVPVGNVTAYIGDFYVFDLLGLRDRPTLLIGMDVLARSRAMAIDYDEQAVYFRRRPHGGWMVN